MKEKVIFDTNFLLEKKMKNFFGKQEELHKFEKLSSILIPDIVIEELKARYKRDLARYFVLILDEQLLH
jgi:rRNA-processing protein FCF1